MWVTSVVFKTLIFFIVFDLCVKQPHCIPQDWQSCWYALQNIIYLQFAYTQVQMVKEKTKDFDYFIILSYLKFSKIKK